MALHWQILAALGLGVLAGALTGPRTAWLGVPLVEVYAFAGTLFLNALKMLIVPLIMASIVTGVAGLGRSEALGRLGMRTLVYYLTTSLLAILTGLVLVDLVQPGLAGGHPVRDLLGLARLPESRLERIAGHGAGDLVEIFLRMVPTNIVQAAAQGQMLGLIFFSLLFGFFLTRIEPPQRETLDRFWQGVFQVMMRMTDIVLRFAPLGVFGLVAKTVATTGFGAFAPLMRFFLTVVAALAVHFLVTLPLLLRLVGRVSPWRHYRAMLPALLTAFSTASSSATLPVTMECVEKKAGVSNRTTSFVLPLGATVNMDGTALYECVAALFIAQAYGVELGPAQQFIVVLTALLTSIGVAGIPAASLVAITIILGAVGLPAEAIGLILAVDRLLDMMRTSVNVFSDSCGAVIIGRLEGERGILEA
ncbi:MAG: dicarboxylate/amino acid:cation symporter [Gammaproteobacteria bacterium]|nr:MAG: dicarboxylate/amino acid:cation symporter [Gammaproteobacteria bacterium]